MKLNDTKLTPSTKFILENMDNTKERSRETEMSCKIRSQHSSDSKLEFYSDGVGEFYLFGGHLMASALIQADSFYSAYYIYLREYVPCDEIENEDDFEGGTFDDYGGFYNESTTADIVALNTDEYTFDFDIKATC